MILLFLGSWRSTLIITISIPLAILAAVAVLSALGETINVMTLGGFALAVGILVDNATVAIENIDRHLENGAEISDAVLDGSAEIIVPATVALLAISIVFVPTFTLSGVAGYLFRPMSEAVIISLVASYVLTYTLVPTMARYLLGRHDVHAHRAESRAAILWRASSAGSCAASSASATAIASLLELALTTPKPFVIGLLVTVVLSFGLAPFLGKNFFPPVEATQIKLHLRAPIGTRIEDTALLCDNVERAIRDMIPASALETIVDNIGLPISGINLAYGNSGTIGVDDADVLITLKDGEEANTDKYLGELRAKLPRLFPGTTFAFLPADIVTQILNFGLPAPIDVQVIGNQGEANRAYAIKLYKEIAKVPGVADARIQQAFNAPSLKVKVDRSRAIDVGPHREGCRELDAEYARRQHSDCADILAQSEKRSVLPDRRAQSPQYWVDSMQSLDTLPLNASGDLQLVGGLASVSRERSNAVVSHYNVQPVVEIYATTEGRDLGAVAQDIDAILKHNADAAPQRIDHRASWTSVAP